MSFEKEVEDIVRRGVEEGVNPDNISMEVPPRACLRPTAPPRGCTGGGCFNTVVPRCCSVAALHGRRSW